MTAEEFLQEDKLVSAIDAIGASLKKEPANLHNRTLLFELLCFSGDLSRAGKQLDVLAGGDADATIAVQRYQNAIEGEKMRRRIFSEGLVPASIISNPPYLEMHVQAMQRVRIGDSAGALALLEEAEALRPTLDGTANGEPFSDWKDANDLIGPFLEIIHGNAYAWLPWETIRSIDIEPPQHLRDLAFLPAKIELHSGPALGEVFIPVLYCGSSEQPDDRLKLGRVTEWRTDLQGLAVGWGQRMFATDARDWDLLEIRSLEFSRPELSNGDDTHAR